MLSDNVRIQKCSYLIRTITLEGQKNNLAVGGWGLPYNLVQDTFPFPQSQSWKTFSICIKSEVNNGVKNEKRQLERERDGFKPWFLSQYHQQAVLKEHTGSLINVTMNLFLF